LLKQGVARLDNFFHQEEKLKLKLEKNSLYIDASLRIFTYSPMYKQIHFMIRESGWAKQVSD
jgi:hypothetical protein